MVGELRHTLSAFIFGNSLFLPQEQLLANHRNHEREDTPQLTRWLRNSTAALARRRPAGFPSTASRARYVV